MVYQQFINYPHLNVFENVAFPLKQRKVDDQEINDVVLKSLKSVGLEGYENRKIQELSGGQQQRVSLARSLVKNAKILLLDEPLVNLDYKLREQLREEFKNIFSQGLSEESIVIFSTTDPREAMELNGEVIVLDEGKVLQVGSAKDIFENPKTLKVAEISNDPPMNILQANIDTNKIKFEGIEVDVPNHLNNVKDKNFNLGIRASNIELSDNGFEFEVELAEISGSETLLHLKRGNAKIITSIEEVMNFNIKDKVKINFNIDKVYAFNENGILVSSPFGGSYV
jgi:glycerol transport system ATP-binding protein